jgi:hypothetical protein
MPNFKIKMASKEAGNGLDTMTLDVTSLSRKGAQRHALKKFPSMRLHDAELEKNGSISREEAAELSDA